MLTIEEFASKYNLNERIIEAHSKRKEFYGIFKIQKMPTIVKKRWRNEFYTVERKRICILKNKIDEYMHRKDIFVKKKREREDWTISSVQCYLNGLDCSKCENWDVACKNAAKFALDNKPPMKQTVLNLYKNSGKPPEYLIEKITA